MKNEKKQAKTKKNDNFSNQDSRSEKNTGKQGLSQDERRHLGDHKHHKK